MSLPYGFISASDGHIIVDSEEANSVKTIYQQYLSGMSLGGIADFLFEHEILSPKGNHWTQLVLNRYCVFGNEYGGKVDYSDELLDPLYKQQ